MFVPLPNGIHHIVRQCIQFGLLIFLTIGLYPGGTVVAQDLREWTEATGSFKIKAALVEVKDEQIFLRTEAGKLVKIPLTRLSRGDRDFLNATSNPFEVVDESEVMQPSADATEPSDSRPSQVGWKNPPQVDWDSIPIMSTELAAGWSYAPSETEELTFEAKTAKLPGKENFFEGMRRLVLNPVAQRAAVGYTWTFSTPTHQSRVSLIDLTSGSSINSELVEANMCPLLVLNDGKTVLMQGTGSDRDGYETNDQLQLWQISGKKVSRSPIWIPFPGEGQGKKNRPILKAFTIENNHILLLCDGRVACFDIRTLIPAWYADLGKDYEIEMTTDRKTLIVFVDGRVLEVSPLDGQVRGSFEIDGKPQLGWTKMRLNGRGDKLLLAHVRELQVYDLRTATLTDSVSMLRGPIANNGLDFVDDDYALLNKSKLVHLPSGISVCQYRDAAAIDSVGGTEFVGILGDQGGIVVPTAFPHPSAIKLLENAVDDPSTFLIYPGVRVSLDMSRIQGGNRSSVESGIRESIERAGYQFANNAEIVLRPEITGPKQEAISYIAAGSYIANTYSSTISILANGSPVFSRSGTNIPGFITTNRDETIQQKLDKLGRQPNLEFFRRVELPKMMQAPSEGKQASADALMSSRFTLQGLVDDE